MKKDEIEKLNKEIMSCKRCPLYSQKTNYVPGDGNPESKIMFIGEAPGREEDIQGKPFVGKAGQYLTYVIKNILEINREDVYITNVLKCRPPNNRDPEESEIRACSIWLERQLEIIQPEFIITLGRHSTKWIFEFFGLKFQSITKNRGKVYEVEKWGKRVKIIPTYHPAAVLYNNKLKDIFESDFSLIKNIIKENKNKKTILDYMK